MAPEITGMYAVPLAVMMIALSTHVTLLRSKTKISILDGGNIQLAERIRRHGNFIENVPMVLLVMAIAELLGAGNLWMHAAGILLVAGRVLHAMGLQSANPATFGRVGGTTATQISLLIAAGSILVHFISR